MTVSFYPILFIFEIEYLYMMVKRYDDLSDPLGSIAAECERCSYSGWGGVARAKFIVELIDRFHLDGFIMHNSRTCKNVALELPHMAKVITEKTGVPGLIFDADHGDPRFYSEEEQPIPGLGGKGAELSLVKTLVETFGGRVWAETESGEGSTFSFVLPTIYNP